MCGCHFCNKAEQNYAPIEGEAMAIARGLEDTKYYTMGCKQLYVATDHKPLVSVLGDQSLADVQNPRLARIKEKTLWWQFRASYNWLLMHCQGGKEPVFTKCLYMRILLRRQKWWKI